MKSWLGDIFSRFPVVVLKRGQVADELPKDIPRTLVVEWDKAVDQLTEDFLSLDAEIRNTAVNLARHLAEDGNDCGIEAIERAIRKRRGGTQCEFYELVHRRVYDPSEPDAATAELATIAANSQLWQRPPAEVQRLIVMSSMTKNQADLLRELEESAGEQQAHAFQLLATHLHLKAKLQLGREKSSNPPLRS